MCVISKLVDSVDGIICDSDLTLLEQGVLSQYKSYMALEQAVSNAQIEIFQRDNLTKELLSILEELTVN